MDLNHKKFSFNDILLVPSYVETSNGNLEIASSCELFGHKMGVPIISSPMDTITEFEMMNVLLKNGAVGVHHRYCKFDKIYKAISNIEWGGIAISPSMNLDGIIYLGNTFKKIFFVVDVAHGYSKKIIDFCKTLKENGIENIVSGNICTPSAGEMFLKIGVNHLRCGIGAGSRCTTRISTGFGYPQGSCLYEIRKELGNDVVIISDGGHNNTGDIVKGLALGCDFIMSGFLFAGTKECPIKDTNTGQVVYRGMASKEALEGRKKEFFVEGESILMKERGSASKIISEIKSALSVACYYGGVSSFKELRDIEKILITENSYLEGLTRK